MGIPLRQGRAFEERDREGQPGVVVVSETLARRYWPGQDPIGKRLKIPLPPTEYHEAWLTVVGVAGDARYRELRATRLDLYMPHLQSDHRPHHLVVRAQGDVSGLPVALQRVVRELDPEQAAPEVVRDDRRGPGGARRPALRGARLLGVSRSSRCCWPPRASTASSPTPSAVARARSACAWPSARGRRTSPGSSSAKA